VLSCEVKLPMTTKIITRIFGGLGNQLFCYAAARRLALINNAELVIDDVSGFAYDSVYKRKYQLSHFNIGARKATAFERLEPFSRFRRAILRHSNRKLIFSKRTYLMQEKIDFDSRLLNLNPTGTIYIEGCWQSEIYFNDIANILRDDLKIKPPIDSINISMAKKIGGCNSVALHVRFFDKIDEISINNVPDDYYNRAVSKMEDLVPGSHYFIFSDQPQDALIRIKLPSERITLVNHNRGDEYAYADLWLMMKCKHFIIANSTFSWWGAWLSDNLMKNIIAPRVEIKPSDGITAWGFKGLLPKEWILL